MYNCPWCPRTLKAKLSNSAKNPGRGFVSCSKDHGGCGLFCFTDAIPDDKYKPKDANAEAAPAPGKRSRVEGTQVVGGINNAPNHVEQRLAELCTEISALRTEILAIGAFVKETTDN